MSEREIFYLAGMPRSGSTLLLNILKQNDLLHVEGTSALLAFMWAAFDVGVSSSLNLLVANNRFPDTTKDIVGSIPAAFYKDVDRQYIIDKNRKWCSRANVNMLKGCFDEAPRVIVLTRKTSEVVASYINIMQKNNKPQAAIDAFLDLENNKLILDAVRSIEDARNYFADDFLFIDYSEIVASPDEQLAKVYDYLGLKPFAHGLSDIADYDLEDDRAYGLDGLHSVRPQIAKREHKVVLDDSVLQLCYSLDKRMQPNRQGLQ